MGDAAHQELGSELESLVAEVTSTLDADSATLGDLRGLHATLLAMATKGEVETFAKELETVQAEIDGVLTEVEELQQEKNNVQEEVDGMHNKHGESIAEQENRLDTIRKENNAWRTTVDEQVLPLEVADRKFRPMLQAEYQNIQIQEQKRAEAAQRRREEQARAKTASQTKAGASVDHKLEASRIAASIKAQKMMDS